MEETNNIVKTKTRKPRSDAGKKRGPNSKIRCDAGKKRDIQPEMRLKSALTMYKKMRSQYLADESVEVGKDTNGIYVPVQQSDRRVDENTIVISRGQRLFRSTRIRKGRYIDLERYRFNALQEIASDQWTAETYSLFANEVCDLLDSNDPSQSPIDSPLDLFVRLYHIREEDYIFWKYEDWRREYSIVYNDSQPLSDDFVFEYNKHVGIDYALEYAEDLKLAKDTTMSEIENSRSYTLTMARMRQYLYSKQYSEVSRKITTDPANSGLTYTQLQTLIDKSIDKDKLDKDLEDYMVNWLEEQIQLYKARGGK